MAIDNRTVNLNLPLPDPANALNEDVLRIIAALQSIDAAVAGKATPTDIATAVAALVDSSPAALNTLKELSLALGNDANFAATLTAALALKAPLASPAFTGTVSGVTAAMVGLGLVDNTSNATERAAVATLTNKTIDLSQNTLLNLPKVAVFRSARTSNTILVAADKGQLIDITGGTFTQTFDAAATLKDGWFCYLRNSGTGDITLDPNASETIDSLTSYVMYPGECRLVQCDGLALKSIVLNSFSRNFTSSGTFTKPPGYSRIEGLLWAGGGSGSTTAYGNYGVMGGGGGACSPFSFNNTSLPSSVAFTIGAGGSSTTGSNLDGSDGGDSSFHLVTAYGGLGGISYGFASIGGSGGGVLSKGFVQGSNFTGGEPGGGYSSGTNGSAYGGGVVGGTSFYGGGGGRNQANYGTGKAVYGGGGGGGVEANNNTPVSGGVSIFGGSGGDLGISANGAPGFAPGGGGGGCRMVGGTPVSGAGGRGELRIWGII